MFRHDRTDEQAIRAVLGGATDDFSALVHRYLPAVRALAQTLLGNAADADDIAQEAFIKAYRDLDQLRDARKFAPWLFAIARNASYNLRRAQNRAVEREQTAAPPECVEPADIERAELHRLLFQKLGALEDGAREVLLLHYFSGKRAKEIAQMLDTTPAAVKKRLQRAREALGASLMRELAPAAGDAEDRKQRARQIMAGVAAAPAAWQGAGAGVAVAGGAGGGIKLFFAAFAATVGILLSIWSGFGFPFPSLHWPSWLGAAPAAVSEAVPPSASVPQTTTPATLPESSEDRPPAGSTEENGDVLVTVVDEQELPVEGAEVRVFAYEEGENPSKVSATARPPVSEGITDAAGQVAVKGASYWYLLEAKQGSRRALGQPRGSERTAHLRLIEVVPLDGSVFDADGRPVAGAMLTPEIHQDLGSFDLEWGSECTATTNESGHFAIKGIPRVPCELSVSAQGHPLLVRKVFPDGRTPLNLAFARGVKVSGQVIDMDSNQPVSGVTLKLADKTVTSGDDGRFDSEPVPAGLVQLSVEQGAHLLANKWKPFQADDGEHAKDIRVGVRRGGVVEGRLYRADSGEPIETNIEVICNSTRQEERSIDEYQRYTRSQSGGGFRVEGLAPATYRVNVSTYRHDKLERKVDWGDVVRIDLPAQTRVDEEIAAAPDTQTAPSSATDTAVISGRVVDSEGRPIPGRSVGVMTVQGNRERAARTGPDGRFEIPKLSGGDYLVFSGTMPSALEAARADTMRLRAGEHKRLHDVVVESAGSLTISGRVAGPDGRPLGGVSVSSGRVAGQGGRPLGGILVSAPGGLAMELAPQNTTTTEDGLFTFGGLSDGEYLLYVTSENYTQGERYNKVQAGTQDVLLKLDHIHRDLLKGRVVRADTGEPFTLFEVAVVRESERDRLNEESFTQYYDAEGRFERLFPYRIPGVVQVVVRASGFGPATVAVEGGPGTNPAEVLFKLDPSRALRGRVTDGSGNAVSDAYVFFSHLPSNLDNPRGEAARTMPSGEFGVSMVPPDATELFVVHPSYAPAQSSIGDLSQPIHISMNEGGTLEGRVWGADGPIAECTLSLSYPGHLLTSFPRAKTDASGAFRFQNLPQGAVRVTMQAMGRTEPALVRTMLEGGCMLMRDAVIEAGKTTVVDFNAAPPAGVVEGQIAVGSGIEPDWSKIVVSVRPGSPENGDDFMVVKHVQDDGSFRVEAPAGEVRVGVQLIDMEAGMLRAARAKATIYPEQTVRQDLALGAGSGAVRCHISGVRGKAYLAVLEGARAINREIAQGALLEIRERAVWQMEVGQDGPVDARGLDPGVYTVMLTYDGAPERAVTATVEVPEHGVAETQLALE